MMKFTTHSLRIERPNMYRSKRVREDVNQHFQKMHQLVQRDQILRIRKLDASIKSFLQALERNLDTSFRKKYCYEVKGRQSVVVQRHRPYVLNVGLQLFAPENLLRPPLAH